MMTKSHAVIVTGPGSLQNGLLALMTAMPQIQVVGEAEDASAALQMVVEHRPDLVLLDMDLPGNEPCAFLRQIKNDWPATRCIALAEDVPQQREAEASGADIALVKGFPPAQLIAIIEGLLQVGERARDREAAEYGQEGEVLP
jgi:DNA-binding NarL/FixJ family response regulator